MAKICISQRWPFPINSLFQFTHDVPISFLCHPFRILSGKYRNTFRKTNNILFTWANSLDEKAIGRSVLSFVNKNKCKQTMISCKDYMKQDNIWMYIWEEEKKLHNQTYVLFSLLDPYTLYTLHRKPYQSDLGRIGLDLIH